MKVYSLLLPAQQLASSCSGEHTFPDHDLRPLSGFPAMNYKQPIPGPKEGRREHKSYASKFFPDFQTFNLLQEDYTNTPSSPT